MNGIESMSNQLTTIPAEPEPKAIPEAKAQSIAQKALETILAQAGTMAKVSLGALEVCRKIGDAATKAKNALGHGKFTTWAETNFGPESGAPFSVQWIRMCMRVHAVFVRIEGSKDREAIIAKFGNDVKNFARLLQLLESDQNPLTFAPEKRAAKLKTDGAPSAGAADPSTKALQKKLDAANEKIAKLEAKLAEANDKIKAQALELASLKAAAKDAAKATKRKPAADVVDAVVKVKALPMTAEQGEKSLEAARAKAKAAANKPKVAPLGAKVAKATKPKAPAKARSGRKSAAAPAPKGEAAPIEVDTSDVPADLLAAAAGTMDTGMDARS